MRENVMHMKISCHTVIHFSKIIFDFSKYTDIRYFMEKKPHFYAMDNHELCRKYSNSVIINAFLWNFEKNYTKRCGCIIMWWQLSLRKFAKNIRSKIIFLLQISRYSLFYEKKPHFYVMDNHELCRKYSNSTIKRISMKLWIKLCKKMRLLNSVMTPVTAEICQKYP